MGWGLMTSTFCLLPRGGIQLLLVVIRNGGEEWSQTFKDNTRAWSN